MKPSSVVLMVMYVFIALYYLFTNQVELGRTNWAYALFGLAITGGVLGWALFRSRDATSAPTTPGSGLVLPEGAVGGAQTTNQFSTEQDQSLPPIGETEQLDSVETAERLAKIVANHNGDADLTLHVHGAALRLGKGERVTRVKDMVLQDEKKEDELGQMVQLGPESE